MKVILCGGGDEITSLESHKLFYNELLRSKKILYIPVAILSKKHTPESCYSWFAKAFIKYTPIKIDMVTTLANVNQSNLNTYDGIYIGGGNTFKLLKEFYDTGFIQLLSNYLKGNGVVYGGSAGAIIFGKNIKTARYSDANDVGLKNTEGFNILCNYSIWCHYSKNDKPNIAELLSEGEKIIAIEENSAIYLKETEIIKIGQGIHLFTSPIEKEFKIDKITDLHY